MEQIEKQHFQKTFYGEVPRQHIRLRGICGRWKRNDKLDEFVRIPGKTYKETTGDVALIIITAIKKISG